MYQGVGMHARVLGVLGGDCLLRGEMGVVGGTL